MYAKIEEIAFALATMASMTYAAPVNSTTFHEEFVRQAQNGLAGACALQPQTWGPHIGIYVPGTLMPSAQVSQQPIFDLITSDWRIQGTGSWGGGLIDNLRGYAADICNPTDWQAVPDGDGTGLIATFYAEVLCTGDKVANAIHAASYGDTYPNGLWMVCNDNLGEQFSATGGFIAQLGEAGAGALAGFLK